MTTWCVHTKIIKTGIIIWPQCDVNFTVCMLRVHHKINWISSILVHVIKERLRYKVQDSLSRKTRKNTCRILEILALFQTKRKKEKNSILCLCVCMHSLLTTTRFYDENHVLCVCSLLTNLASLMRRKIVNTSKFIGIRPTKCQKYKLVDEVM